MHNPLGTRDISVRTEGDRVRLAGCEGAEPELLAGIIGRADSARPRRIGEVLWAEG